MLIKFEYLLKSMQQSYYIEYKKAGHKIHQISVKPKA